MGFGAIPEQDARIPHDRKQLIQRIEHDLMPDKNVIGIFYGGSLGNHTTDVYSDIDLRIVVKDDAFEAYRSAKRTRAGQWGNVLFFEDHPSSIYCIAHYDTFIKVDAFYYKKSGSSQNWLDRKIGLLTLNEHTAQWVEWLFFPRAWLVSLDKIRKAFWSLPFGFKISASSKTLKLFWRLFKRNLKCWYINRLLKKLTIGAQSFLHMFMKLIAER